MKTGGAGAVWCATTGSESVVNADPGIEGDVYDDSLQNMLYCKNAACPVLLRSNFPWASYGQWSWCLPRRLRSDSSLLESSSLPAARARASALS